MADQDLTIGLHLDRSPASAAAWRGEMRNLHQGLASDSKAAGDKDVAEAKRVADAKRKIAADAAGSAADASRQARDAQVGHGRDVEVSLQKIGDTGKIVFEKIGVSGVGGFVGIAQAIPGVLMGMERLNSLARIYLDAVTEAGDKLRAQGKGLLDQLEPLGRIAALQGKDADIGFVKDQAKQRQRTLLTRDESTRAQEAFANSGQQFIGKGEGKIDQETANKIFEKTAGLGVAKKFDPAAVADLTGRTLGMADYSKDGAAAPDKVGSMVNRTMSILEAGGGDAPTLVKEVTRIAAASVNEDEARGSFKNPAEVAKIISVMNEVAPGQESEMTRAAMRGLRDFKGKKSGPILKEAGIGPADTFVEALEKLAPVLEKKARAGPKGTTIKDIVGKPSR